MSTSLLPQIIDQLIERATEALPEDLVTDGFGLSDQPLQRVLMVGVDDANAPSGASSVDAEQVPATAGTPRSRTETGIVNCVAFALNGEGNQRAARVDAYAVMGAVETLLRDDPTLGLSMPQMMNAELGSHRLEQDQFTEGAGAWVAFTVKYEARI